MEPNLEEKIQTCTTEIGPPLREASRGPKRGNKVYLMYTS
jgi:hypothetical protein